MTPLWPLALITFKEGIRNRALYGIALFAFALFGFNVVIANMAPRDVGKVAVDIALSTVALSGLLLVLFVAINLMAKDLDKRTIYMVLARPISRSQYVLGKFIGLCLLILTTIVVLAVFANLSILTLKLIYPNYFERFSWMLVEAAVGYILLSLFLLLSVSILFSSLTTSSFITLVLTVIVYIIGQSLSDVRALLDAPPASGLDISPVTAVVIQAAYYLLPNLSLFDVKSQVAHGIALSWAYVAYSFLYGAVYISIMLFLATFFFRKREFP